MDGTAGAFSLARATLHLFRARASGVLRVQAGNDVWRIAIACGVPRAVASQRAGRSLGDLLIGEGELDLAAHRLALQNGAPPRLVGGWLVGAGAATATAVERALRRQLSERVLSAFTACDLDYAFERGDADVGVPWVNEPVSGIDLVVGALRGLPSAAQIERFVGEEPEPLLSLSGLGRLVLEQAALWPDEAAALTLCDRGTRKATLEAAGVFTRRAKRLLCALSLISAVAVRDARSDAYALLLRKRAQVLRGASARELLDLPAFAHAAQARRALRRLAAQLHPDVMEAHAPKALRAVSTEIMAGIAQAERALRDA